MEFSWGPTMRCPSGALFVRLDAGGQIRCGEVYQKYGKLYGKLYGMVEKWTYVLSLRIAPVNFVVEDHLFDTEQEAKEALQTIATVLIIGGNHERNRTENP